jgi:hypothetical protein
MHNVNTGRTLRVRGLLAVLTLVACSVAVRAQDAQGIEVNEATPQGGAVVIKLKFKKVLEQEDRAAALDAANYSVIDTTNEKFMKVCSSGPCAPALLYPNNDTSKKPNLVQIQVTEALSLGEKTPEGEANVKNRYYVQARNLTAKGKPVGKTLLASLPLQGSASETPGTGESKFEVTEDRDKADVYISGELARASGTDFTGSGDIKLKYTFIKDIGRRGHYIGPVFDFRGSTDPKADPDSVKFGLDWETPLTGGATVGVIWKNDGKFEADRDFDNVNLTWGSRFTFLPEVWQRGEEGASFYIDPFIGTELGKNLKSPVAEADGGGLGRLLAGASLNLRIPLKDVGKESALSLAVTYERRWPLKREVTIEEDDDGNLKSVTFGTNPRDWVDAKLIFKFNKFFGPFVGYQYGSQPPAFKLVDHQLKMGFLVSARRKN